jgi:NADH-ubiquinone oxidoreductase chain 5
VKGLGCNFVFKHYKRLENVRINFGFFPLVSFFNFRFFLVGLLGRSGATVFVNELNWNISRFVFFYRFYEVGAGGICNSGYLTIVVFQLELFIYRGGFLFDSITSSMLVVVLTISFFCFICIPPVTWFLDPFLVRFYVLLVSLYIFLCCVWLQVIIMFKCFLVWEGVGLSSYLLINFWFYSFISK